MEHQVSHGLGVIGVECNDFQWGTLRRDDNEWITNQSFSNCAVNQVNKRTHRYTGVVILLGRLDPHLHQFVSVAPCF